VRNVLAVDVARIEKGEFADFGFGDQRLKRLLAILIPWSSPELCGRSLASVPDHWCPTWAEYVKLNVVTGRSFAAAMPALHPALRYSPLWLLHGPKAFANGHRLPGTTRS